MVELFVYASDWRERVVVQEVGPELDDLRSLAPRGASALYYAGHELVICVTLLCALVTALLYMLARALGRIPTHVHTGLGTFWNSVVLGDVCACVLCVAAAVGAYALDGGRPQAVLCSTLQPVRFYLANACLLVWLAFLVSVLRASVAVAWLHRIRSAERLVDLSRGLALLCLTLLFLVPLAVASQSRVAEAQWAEEGDSLTVCVPAYRSSAPLDWVHAALLVTWATTTALATLCTGRRGCRVSGPLPSVLAAPLALLTQHGPMLLLFLWLADQLSLREFRHAALALYSLYIALQALCNVFNYKLFLLAHPDKDCTSAQCTTENCMSAQCMKQSRTSAQCMNLQCTSAQCSQQDWMHAHCTHLSHVVGAEKTHLMEMPPASTEKVQMV